MKNKKILLIEDNVEISNNIKQYLELEEFVVDVCYWWECWLEKSLWKDYDLILLDLMLPEVDGFRIAQKISSKKNTPIIIITAKENIEDKIKGFESGAIDYLVKPFDLRELLIRINLQLNNWISENTFELWDLQINLEKRKFKLNWENIKITQKEFLLVEILLSNKWRPVSRTDIIEYIWWEEWLFDNDSKLDVYISVLRSKLWKDFIKTIKWFWYEVE